MGAGPQFSKAKAAVVNFASGLEHPLSPLSVMRGVPKPLGDVVDQIQALKLMIETREYSLEKGGYATAAVRNYTNRMESILNSPGRPMEAYIVLQTATYRDVPFLFFFTTKQWVANPVQYIRVDGPVFGYFDGKNSAASAASAALGALEAQLKGAP